MPISTNTDNDRALFDFHISFTGACGYIFDPGQSKMMAVMINGVDAVAAGKKALDGTPLKDHRGFIRFKLKHLLGPQHPHGESDVVVYLNRERVTFHPTPPNDFQITKDNRAKDVRNIPAMKEAANGFGDIDETVLRPPGNRPRGDILAQVIVDSGTVAAERLNELDNWSFVHGELVENFSLKKTIPGGINRFSTTAQPRPLTDQLGVTMNNLRELEIRITHLDTKKVKYLPLIPASSDRSGQRPFIDLTIANLCDDNPLQWESGMRSRSPKSDPDVKWLYHLCKNSAQLQAQLGSNELPIPTLSPDTGGGGGSPAKCMGLRFNDISFK